MSNILCLYWGNPTFYPYIVEKLKFLNKKRKVYFVSRSYKDYFYKKEFLKSLCYSTAIWHLENNDLTVPSEKLHFDNQPQCSIKFETYFEYIERTKFIENKTLKTNKIVFFTNKPFNAYLNEASKVQFNPSNYNLDQAPLFDKITTLLDTSRSWIKNANYHDYYYNNIGLEYSLIFQDPEKFVDNLYEILDSINLSYNKNRKYCLLSIKNYKKTKK